MSAEVIMDRIEEEPELILNVPSLERLTDIESQQPPRSESPGQRVITHIRRFKVAVVSGLRQLGTPEVIPGLLCMHVIFCTCLNVHHDTTTEWMNTWNSTLQGEFLVLQVCLVFRSDLTAHFSPVIQILYKNYCINQTTSHSYNTIAVLSLHEDKFVVLARCYSPWDFNCKWKTGSDSRNDTLVIGSDPILWSWSADLIPQTLISTSS